MKTSPFRLDLEANLRDRVRPSSPEVERLLEARTWPDPVAAAIGACGEGWAISPAFAQVLATAILELGASRVLEFGAGASSRVVAAALGEAGGGTLTSFEEDPDWCAEPWAEAVAVPGVDAHMIVAGPRMTLGRFGLYYRYDAGAQVLADRGPFDLVVVDAPQGKYGREGALPVAWDHLSPGALIVVDDAERRADQWGLWRWLEVYDLDLVAFEPSFHGKGIAVLRVRGRARTPALWPFLVGVRHGLLRRRGLRATGQEAEGRHPAPLSP